jgi:hypothetical protein
MDAEKDWTLFDRAMTKVQVILAGGPASDQRSLVEWPLGGEAWPPIEVQKDRGRHLYRYREVAITRNEAVPVYEYQWSAQA